MKWYDGECGAAEEQRLSALVKESAGSRAHVEALTAVGNWVRYDFERRVDGLPDYTDAIMAGLEDRAADRSGVRLIVSRTGANQASGRETARKARSTEIPRGTSGGLFRDRDWWRRGAFCGLAIAAAIVLSVIGRNAHPTGRVHHPEREGAKVERVDFGEVRGSIYMVRGAENVTPVIWLTEPKAGSSARM